MVYGVWDWEIHKKEASKYCYRIWQYNQKEFDLSICIWYMCYALHCSPGGRSRFLDDLIRSRLWYNFAQSYLYVHISYILVIALILWVIPRGNGNVAQTSLRVGAILLCLKEMITIVDLLHAKETFDGSQSNVHRFESDKKKCEMQYVSNMNVPRCDTIIHARVGFNSGLGVGVGVGFALQTPRRVFYVKQQ